MDINKASRGLESTEVASSEMSRKRYSMQVQSFISNNCLFTSLIEVDKEAYIRIQDRSLLELTAPVRCLEIDEGV